MKSTKTLLLAGIACMVPALAFAHGEDQGNSDQNADLIYAQSVPSFEAWQDMDSCEKGDLEGCHAYANRLHGGIGVERDGGRAVELYRSNCESGFAYSCYNVGARHWLGEGVSLDTERAEELFESACDGGVAEACYMWSIALGAHEGEEALTRLEGARERGCSLGMQVLCSEGRANEDAKNLQAWVSELGAADYVSLAGACENGSARACTELAFGLEEAGLANARETEELHRSACDWGVLSSCERVPSEER